MPVTARLSRKFYGNLEQRMAKMETRIERMKSELLRCSARWWRC